MMVVFLVALMNRLVDAINLFVEVYFFSKPFVHLLLNIIFRRLSHPCSHDYYQQLKAASSRSKYLAFDNAI